MRKEKSNKMKKEKIKHLLIFLCNPQERTNPNIYTEILDLIVFLQKLTL